MSFTNQFIEEYKCSSQRIVVEWFQTRDEKLINIDLKHNDLYRLVPYFENLPENVNEYKKQVNDNIVSTVVSLLQKRKIKNEILPYDFLNNLVVWPEIANERLSFGSC